MDYLTISWGIDKGLDLGFITIRYYSLLFALGFILGFLLMRKIFIKEKVELKKLDTLLNYTVIATIVGARLGHVFFYEWEYYSDHVSEIFKVWEGGLASHGAAIALIIAMYIYGKRVLKMKDGMFWTLDRLVIMVALAACFIRFGNWTNSEIYGRMQNSSVETVFTIHTTDFLKGNRTYGAYFSAAEMTPTGDVYETDSINYPVYDLAVTIQPEVSKRQALEAFGNAANAMNARINSERNTIVLPDINPEVVDGVIHTQVLGVPRLPTQLFESLAYLLIFVILWKLYGTGDYKDRRGFLFGAFLVLVFGFRFFIEFYKANQTEFEAHQAYNMGQLLSIPLVLIGIVFIARAMKNKSVETTKA